MKARVAIIGGTGVGALLPGGTAIRVGTPYGPSPTMTLHHLEDRNVVCLPRHGQRHDLPPHKINYRSNIWALHSLSVERIFATSAVGGINPAYAQGALVIPRDFIDFTRSRHQTFYDSEPVTHIDVSQLYCPNLRNVLNRCAKARADQVWADSIYLCTEGPRYESPAEIGMFRSFGCDVVGMTGIPEAILARELEMCYATLCFVTNRAAGMRDRISAEDVMVESRRIRGVVQEVLRDAVTSLPRRRRCRCSRTLEGARV
jgi:5'-methylthioadenosine phosphorylase